MGSEPDLMKRPLGGKEISVAPAFRPSISMTILSSSWVVPDSIPGMTSPMTSSVTLATFLRASISPGSLIIRRSSMRFAAPLKRAPLKLLATSLHVEPQMWSPTPILPSSQPRSMATFFTMPG